MEFDFKDVDQSKYSDYGATKGPDERDASVENFVNAVLEGKPYSARSLDAQISHAARRVLFSYAERSADHDRAVATPKSAARAFAAALLGSPAVDEDEYIALMARLESRALESGIHPDAVVLELDRSLGETAAALLTPWLARLADGRRSAAERDWSDAAHGRFDLSRDPGAAFYRYGAAPIPDPRDEPLGRFIDSVMTGGLNDVDCLVADATNGASNAIGAYGRRMASAAVRTQLQELLVRGLGAAVLGGLDQGRYDAQITMALLEDAAGRIHADFERLAEQAASSLGAAGSSLIAWLQRPPESRTTEAMGFVAGSDAEGFRYVRMVSF